MTYSIDPTALTRASRELFRHGNHVQVLASVPTPVAGIRCEAAEEAVRNLLTETGGSVSDLHTLAAGLERAVELADETDGATDAFFTLRMLSAFG